MGWIRRILGSEEAAGPASSQFYESEPDSESGEGSRNAPRRELVQVVLRDTMRKHGIPSDWIEVRILSAVTRSGRPGLHVNFVVREAHEQLLGYVFAFQDSFEAELARFEPRAADWLLSIGWEFKDHKLGGMAMPDPLSWSRAAAQAPATPGPAPAPPPPTGSPARPMGERQSADDDIQRDLQALFAIRDAAIAETARERPAPAPQDFQPTRPFDTDTPPEQR